MHLHDGYDVDWHTSCPYLSQISRFKITFFRRSKMLKSVKKIVGAMSVVLLVVALVVPPAFASSASGSRTVRSGNSMIGGRLVQSATINKRNGTKRAVRTTEGYVNVFGRTFRAYRESATAQKNGNAPATAEMGITVSGNTLTVSSTILRNFNIASAGTQIFVGPVPVWVSGEVVLFLSGGPSISHRRNTSSVSKSLSSGLSVLVTAAAGVSVAYIGVEGSASPLTATATSSITFTSNNVGATVTLWVGGNASVAVVARVGQGLSSAIYRHVIAEWILWGRTWTILSATV